MQKPGISVDIPGHGSVHLRTMVTDYTGTLSKYGTLCDGVKDRLIKLCLLIDIHVLTSDTFGTATKQLEGIELQLVILEADKHDYQKKVFVEKFELPSVVAFGNGRNDSQMLQTVKDGLGVAVAVNTGEGCNREAILASNIFHTNAADALEMLLQTNVLKADLRF